MTVNRRTLEGYAAGAAVLVPEFAHATDSIRVGSIIDASGIFDLYGKPMDKAVTHYRGDQRCRWVSRQATRESAV